MGDIEKRVVDVIGCQLAVDVDHVKLTDRLDDDLGADSLDKVELIIAIEDAFDVSIDDEKAEKVVTVQDAIDALKYAMENS